MKKLNLKLDDIKEMLTKEQMKKITGGYGICYESCGKKEPPIDCNSVSGNCSRDAKNNTWIQCDGNKYSCPAS